MNFPLCFYFDAKLINWADITVFRFTQRWCSRLSSQCLHSKISLRDDKLGWLSVAHPGSWRLLVALGGS